MALAKQLEDPTLLQPHWPAAGGGQIEVHNPSTCEVLGTVPSMSGDDVHAAISKAHDAFILWSSELAKERANTLRKWFNLIMEARQDLAVIASAEMGKPLSESLGEVSYAASFVEWFAEEAKRVYSTGIPEHQRGQRLLVVKQPIGVVGAICPWNFPLAMITRKVSPALASGCAVVLKPSELSPFSAAALVVLAGRAGLPSGALQLLTGDSVAIVKEMTRSSLVRKITFTGSTRVGKIVLSQCAETVKKVSLELGGNAPFIVFPDADLDDAVQNALICKYRNSGQTCVCANRIFVHNSVYDEFSQKLLQKVKELKVGDPFSEGVNIGPLINKAAIAKCKAHVEDAKAKGAAVLCGGNTCGEGDRFFEPTVLTEVGDDMAVTKEETFGPVAALLRFDSEESVVQRANETEGGLAGYFCTKDFSRAWRVAEALQCGIVGVNTGLISTETAPFGGVKQSGLGREGAKFGIDECMEMKYICFGGI